MRNSNNSVARKQLTWLNMGKESEWTHLNTYKLSGFCMQEYCWVFSKDGSLVLVLPVVFILEVPWRLSKDMCFSLYLIEKMHSSLHFSRTLQEHMNSVSNQEIREQRNLERILQMSVWIFVMCVVVGTYLNTPDYSLSCWKSREMNYYLEFNIVPVKCQ